MCNKNESANAPEDLTMISLSSLFKAALMASALTLTGCGGGSIGGGSDSIITRLPDLTISHFSVASNTVSAGDTLEVTYTIENIGRATAATIAGEYSIAFYASLDVKAAPTEDLLIDYVGVFDPLAPGESVTSNFTIDVPDSLSTEDYVIYAVADPRSFYEEYYTTLNPGSFENIDINESDETNNIALAFETVRITNLAGSCTLDTYEDDDAFSIAKPRRMTTQNRNFCYDSRDLITVDAATGNTYQATVTHSGSSAIYMISLYDEQENLINIAREVSGPVTLTWNATSNQTYTVEVAPTFGRDANMIISPNNPPYGVDSDYALLIN